MTDASVEESGAYYVFAINDCGSLDTSNTADVIVEPCNGGP